LSRCWLWSFFFRLLFCWFILFSFFLRLLLFWFLLSWLYLLFLNLSLFCWLFFCFPTCLLSICINIKKWFPYI